MHTRHWQMGHLHREYGTNITLCNDEQNAFNTSTGGKANRRFWTTKTPQIKTEKNDKFCRLVKVRRSAKPSREVTNRRLTEKNFVTCRKVYLTLSEPQNSRTEARTDKFNGIKLSNWNKQTDTGSTIRCRGSKSIHRKSFLNTVLHQNSYSYSGHLQVPICSHIWHINTTRTTTTLISLELLYTNIAFIAHIDDRSVNSSHTR